MEEQKKEKQEKKIAVIRVKGLINIKKEMGDTLTMMNLHNKNYCVILEGNSSNLGMIKKVKDLVTWGEIDQETEKLLEKRKEKDKKFFRLHPPRGGFGRKGIKVPFKIGGGLGYRKEKINDLIKKMI